MNTIRNPVSIEFLRTEVETTAVFARIALEANDSEKKHRNVRHARRGYDTLQHFVKTLALTNDEKVELEYKISELRRQLIGLGENV